MSFILAPGTAVAIASGYGSAKSMTALTNAANAVATLEASHGVAVGNILELTSGWPKADKRVMRASAVSTNDVTIEGLDTSSTTQYPPGSGVGSVRRITAWTSLSQIAQDISSSGGQQQFASIRLLSQEDEIALPTTRTPVTLTLPAYYDPALAYLTIVRAARDSKTPTAVRMVFPNGAVLYGNAYWGLNDVPSVRDGVLSTDITLNFAAQPIVYAS
jgi:hypothetical protein